MKKTNNIKKFASNPKLLKIHVELHGHVLLELLWHVIWVLALATEKKFSMASVQVSCDMQEPKKKMMKFRWPDKLAWYYFNRRSNWQFPTVKYYLVPRFCSPILNSRLFLIVRAHNDINGHQNHFRRFTDKIIIYAQHELLQANWELYY